MLISFANRRICVNIYIYIYIFFKKRKNQTCGRKHEILIRAAIRNTYIKVMVKQAKEGYSLFSSGVVLEGFWDSDEDKGGASAVVSVAS